MVVDENSEWMYLGELKGIKMTFFCLLWMVFCAISIVYGSLSVFGGNPVRSKWFSLIEVIVHGALVTSAITTISLLFV